MTMKIIITLLCISMLVNVKAQNSNKNLPYREISHHPESYTSGAVVARMIDGLGFRFYWATEGLNESDLSYQPSESARTTFQTMQHVFDLSKIILNSALKVENVSDDTSKLNYVELRQLTLNNLKSAADIFRETPDLSLHPIKFANRETPFWFQINGPISDAIWHCGQIASFRRTSGNPINSDVSFFSGTAKN